MALENSNELKNQQINNSQSYLNYVLTNPLTKPIFPTWSHGIYVPGCTF